MINKKRLIKLTRALIGIDSQNPPGDESGIAVFVRDYLKKLGLRTALVEFKKKRPNIIAHLRGADRSRALLITPHLDTVPAGKNWKVPPFAGTIAKGRIYGLGATDCKGNLAVSLETINSLVEEGELLGYNLIFAATADEEAGSGFGLIPLLDRGILKPDAAVVLDADDFNIVVAQKGLLHLKVKLRGRKAHGAYPWQGINAIDIAVGILKELQKYKFGSKRNKYLKKPTLNTGTISGGDKVNVVADWCEFELDFRFTPGMSEKKFLSDLDGIIRRQVDKFFRGRGIPQNAGKIEIEGIQRSYLIRETHPLVKLMAAAMEKFRVKPQICGSEGATTITFFQDKKIPAVATGFGFRGCAHIADEYARIDDLYKGALVLEEFLKEYK